MSLHNISLGNNMRFRPSRQKQFCQAEIITYDQELRSAKTNREEISVSGSDPQDHIVEDGDNIWNPAMTTHKVRQILQQMKYSSTKGSMSSVDANIRPASTGQGRAEKTETNNERDYRDSKDQTVLDIPTDKKILRKKKTIEKRSAQRTKYKYDQVQHEICVGGRRNCIDDAEEPQRYARTRQQRVGLVLRLSN